MSLWKLLPGQLAEHGRHLEAQIGRGRFSLITSSLSWRRSRTCIHKSQSMHLYHSRTLPQHSAAAEQGRPRQSGFSSPAFSAQMLQQLRGFSQVYSHVCRRGAISRQQRLPCSAVRAGQYSTSSNNNLMGVPLGKHPMLPQPQFRQTCRIPALRATLTSDAATRKHLPQHLQDAYQRKQVAPRSNAYSSAVAQAEEEYGEAAEQYSGRFAGGTAQQTPAEEKDGVLASDEQVQRLEGALAVASASVEGTIQGITFENKDTGYRVLKVAALHTAGESPEQRIQAAKRPARTAKGVDSKSIVTVVGILPHADKGQQLRFVGDWVVHAKHGWQLKATAYEEVEPKSPQAVAAYLSSTIPGVGYATATKLVNAFGTSVLTIMDEPDAVQKLSEVAGIGRTNAAKFKQLWDASRELREMRQFVKRLGLTGRLAHLLVERHGKYTEARLRQDPYFCLYGMPGVTFRVAEDLAWAVNTPTDLPSRGATAFLHTLQLAADKAGHTHLPWGVLLTQTQRLLSGTGRPWKDAERLQEIALQLQRSGHIVVEDPASELLTEPKPARLELPPLPQVFGSAMWEGAADGQVGANGQGGSLKDHVQRESLERYLTSRIQGVGPSRAAQLVEAHGVDILRHLESGDAELAIKKLSAISGVGRKTAEQMLRNWTLNPKRVGPWRDPSAGMGKGDSTADGAEASSSAPDSEPQWPWDPASCCYLADMHETEVRVAASLSRIAAQQEHSSDGWEERVDAWDKKRREVEKKHGGKETPLSEGQRAALMRASRAPLIVLTGGPGCGKTFATKAIVQLWVSQGKDVKLAAPTGRAAERLQEEAGAKNGKVAIKASTIHRLLNYKSWSQRRLGGDDTPAEGGKDLEGFFAFNARQPLEAPGGRLSILVDETSMVDMSLASSLLDAIPTHIPVQLVLVGDADQLPPVSAGSFLSAAIDSGVVPVVDLREVFRQAQGSDIVKAAHAVHAGQMPPLMRINPSQPSEESRDRQALWVAPQSLADIEDEVVRTVQSTIMTDRGVDVRRDLQVLTPMRKGPAGVQSLNARLQALLNPPEKGRGEVRISTAAESPLTLRVGDRVIQSVNNYDKEVFNGDPGYIVSADASARRVRVRFPSSGAESGAGREVEYMGAELWEIELAWATTVHKAQGSESKAVIVVLSPQHRPLLTRRLFYTAITRAREALVVVGSEAAMRTALQGTQGDVRLTSLHARLAAAADRLDLPRCAPVVYGQGFASVDAAVSQKVSDSVHQAQEEQHLDDLAASTRQQAEAVRELDGSGSDLYNNGSGSAGAAPAEDFAGPGSARAAAAESPSGSSSTSLGAQKLPTLPEEAVPSSHGNSAAPQQADRRPAAAAPTGSAVGRPRNVQKKHPYAPKHQALGGHERPLRSSIKKAGSLQGLAQQARPVPSGSTQSSV